MSSKVDELLVYKYRNLEVTIVSVHAADEMLPICPFTSIVSHGIVRYDSCRLNFAEIMIT